MTIKQLVEKYTANRAYYLTNKYNETLLRSDFLDPFFELIGWDIKNNAGKTTNEREVILEEALKADASENSKKPDYTFRLYAERKFFVEAKKPCVAIETSTDSAKQVRRYGFTAKLKISVLSNFEYLIIYDTSVKVEATDNHNKALIRKFHYTEYEDQFDEIKKLLGRDAVYSGSFEIEWQSIETKLNQFSIDTLFLNQLNEWRKLLGNEILKHQPNINDRELNDAVQSYLNRILFLRVCEDRNLEDYKSLLKLSNGNDFKALVKKFKQADNRYNSGLFDQLLTDEVIENISSAFWKIIQQLYYPESPYSFSVFSSDILGRIYEIFLSEKLTSNNNTIALVKKPENQERDVVTTPTFIITDILRNTVLPKCKDKTDKEILTMRFADIACGSGAFLLELFQLLNDILIDYYLNADKSVLVPVGINTYRLPFTIKQRILLNCIYGVDKDYNAFEATKFGLLLKLLEDESTSTTTVSKPILPRLTNNIFFGNSLLTPAQVNKKYQTEINPFDFPQTGFDVIVGNPPYMSTKDMKNITPLELPLYKVNYSSAYKQFDKYFLFLEQGMNLLKPDGVLGYIVPSKFTKVGAGKKLREELSANGYLHSIVSFGANQVFADKTTYTCLLILYKTPQATFQYAEIKSLRSWKLREPGRVNYAVKNTNELDNDAWVLVPPELSATYNKIQSQSSRLIDLVDEKNIFNGIQTSANDVFIFTPTQEDVKYYFFSKKGGTYQVEKAITKAYFQTSAGSDNLNTYRTFKPNARVIYPYKNGKKGVELIPLTTIQKKYPQAFDYLQKFKARLNDPKRDIQPEPTTSNEWHRYGRQQSLSVSEKKEKIILGVLSNGDKYAVDKYGTLFTSGGTAGYCAITLPENFAYSIYYLQAILNSKYVEWFVILTGEIFRGSYFARGTKVLNNLPIRTIDFTNATDKALHDEIAVTQQALISLQDQIDLNTGNNRVLLPLKGQFAREKVNLNKLLVKLYDLGNDDSLIPTIKDLYEAN